jgi:hypothetical protein
MPLYSINMPFARTKINTAKTAAGQFQLSRPSGPSKQTIRKNLPRSPLELSMLESWETITSGGAFIHLIGVKSILARVGQRI